MLFMGSSAFRLIVETSRHSRDKYTQMKRKYYELKGKYYKQG